jgi:hypothetical protein
MAKLSISRPDRRPAPGPAQPLLSLSAVRHRMNVLKILVPGIMLVLVGVYELGPARWIQTLFGDAHHFWAEILFYGTLGPALAYVVLEILSRWLEERETNELQSRVLAQAREQAKAHDKLSDDALQALFAATILLSSLETTMPELSPETVAQLRGTRQALEQTILRVSAYLRNKYSLDGQNKAGSAK